MDDEHLRETKELKVQLPVRQHIRLHSLKILTDRTISETVAEALQFHLGDELAELPVGDPTDAQPSE